MDVRAELRRLANKDDLQVEEVLDILRTIGLQYRLLVVKKELRDLHKLEIHFAMKKDDDDVEEYLDTIQICGGVVLIAGKSEQLANTYYVLIGVANYDLFVSTFKRTNTYRLTEWFRPYKF